MRAKSVGYFSTRDNSAAATVTRAPDSHVPAGPMPAQVTEGAYRRAAWWSGGFRDGAAQDVVADAEDGGDLDLPADGLDVASLTRPERTVAAGLHFRNQAMPEPLGSESHSESQRRQPPSDVRRPSATVIPAQRRIPDRRASSHPVVPQPRAGQVKIRRIGLGIPGDETSTAAAQPGSVAKPR